MNDLIEIIHLLSPLELSVLKKEMKGDKQKLKLLEYLLANDEINNDEIIEVLNYQNNKNAYYTFKHRIIQEIITFKMKTGKNKVIKIREEINNLRTLLYSNQPLLLEKKINDLAKRAAECEIYNDVREIYFCSYLLNFDDSKKREECLKKMHEAERNEIYFNELEYLFYKIIFHSQDLYYSFLSKRDDLTEKTLDRMKDLNEKLNSKISNFLYESSLITCRLNSKKETDPDFINRIKSIYLDYINSPLQFYYPNCKFAIHCLVCKYYLNTGNFAEYEATLLELEKDLPEIIGYRTYEDVYFYYLYSKVILLVKKKRFDEVQEIMENTVTDSLLRMSSNKINFYLLFLKGVGYFYGGNPAKAYSCFLKARNYTKFLEEQNSWVMIETSVFALLALAKEANLQLIESEKKYLKRNIKKCNSNEDIFMDFLGIYNAKVKGKKANKLDQMLHDFEVLQSEDAPLQLLDIHYFLEN